MSAPEKHCLECGAALSPGYPALVCAPCLWSAPEEGAGDFAKPPETIGNEAEDSASPQEAAEGVLRLRVPGHDVLEEIARGGMGVVYRARERETQRTVALKMLRPGLADEEGMRERFRLEASAAAALDHPAILPVYRVDESDDMPFFTMKLASDGTLAERRESLRGQWRVIAELFVHLAGAVQYAHQHGVLHRDLKPQNVLFDESGQVFLADFGLVKLIDSVSDLTGSRSFMGTPHYSAPEVAAANARVATVSSDIWSLGAMLYELLTGRLPFKAEGLASLLRRIADEPPPPILTVFGIPRDLTVITLKCLQKNPAQRYESAGALAADLRAWLEGRPIQARPASFAEKTLAWARRNPLPASMAAALALSLGVVSLLLLRGLHASRQAEADARLRETASRKAEISSREAEAASLLEETRARLRGGQWVDRRAAIESVLRSQRLRPSESAREVLLSLLALPQLEMTGSVPYSLGRPVFFSGNLDRYVTSEKDSVAVRSTKDSSVLHTIPEALHPSYPPGPLSLDGQRLMLRVRSGSSVWDIPGGRQLFAFPQKPGGMALSADGRRAASAGLIADLRAEPPKVCPAGPEDPDFTVRAVSPDGARVLTASAQRLRLRLLDAENGGLLQEYGAAGESMVHCLEWAGDGRSFYTGSVDGKLARWSAGESMPDWILPAHGDGVDSLAVFDGGRHIITQGRDGQTRFWDMRTMSSVLTLPWSGLRVMASTDGLRLAVDCPPDKASRLYSFTPPRVCTLVRLPPSLVTNSYFQGEAAVIFAADSASFAVTSGHDIHILDREGIRLRSLPCERCDGLAPDPAGGFARIRNSSPVQVAYRCPPDWKEAWNDPRLRLADARGSTSLIAGSPAAGRLLLNIGGQLLTNSPSGAGTGTGTTLVPVPVRRKARELGPLTETSLPGLEADGRLSAMSFSPSGQYLAVSGIRSRAQSRTRIALHRAADLSLIQEFPAPAEASALAFTADERALLTGDGNSIACLELDTGRERWRIPHQRPQIARNHAPVRLATAAGTGALAATLSPETVSLLDPQTGAILRTFRHPVGRTIRNFGLSPDGSRLVTIGSYLVQIWRLDAVEEELETYQMAGPTARL